MIVNENYTKVLDLEKKKLDLYQYGKDENGATWLIY